MACRNDVSTGTQKLRLLSVSSLSVYILSVAQCLEYQEHKMNVRLAAQIFSGPTVNFTRVIDRTFDILNSRCPQAKGYKPLQPKSKDTWENHLKTFIIGFAATIKSTIQMANEMFSRKEKNPYLLTYKFSQDHLELLFCCLRCRDSSSPFQVHHTPST